MKQQNTSAVWKIWSSLFSGNQTRKVQTQWSRRVTSVIYKYGMFETTQFTSPKSLYKCSGSVHSTINNSRVGPTLSVGGKSSVCKDKVIYVVTFYYTCSLCSSCAD